MLSLILALLPLVSAANTFIGCSTTSGSFESLYYSYLGAQTSQRCADICGLQATTAIVYSYHINGHCDCSITPPSAETYAGSVAGGSDTCDSESTYSVYRIGTTFNFDGCYVSNGITTAFPAFVTQSIDGCFDSCRGSTGLLVSPDIESNIFQCLCGSDSFTPPSTFSTQSSCVASSENFYYFPHPFPAASAQLNRKRQLRQSPANYCPGSMTACRIEGSKDGYECLDTTSELESCGGCVYGRYGATTIEAEGVNCAELAGDNFGSMTCKMGQCVEEF